MPSLDQALTQSGNAILDARARRYAEMRTPEQVRQLQTELRRVARELLGPWVLDQMASDAPPRVMWSGTLEQDGVVVEKLLYEALPDFWVPTVIWRPAKVTGRCPAVVFPVGHWWEGKATSVYQRLMRLLARRGVICASVDSVGQGERIENYLPVVKEWMKRVLETVHPKGAPIPFPFSDSPLHGYILANNVTAEHCLIGERGYLCGVHLNALTAGANKRLVDLLVRRGDVDAARIGVCGASGGGADARYLVALDERIVLAAPTSIFGSDRALSGGDADQSLFGSLAHGISQVDLLICAAPNPLLLVSASQDRHSPQKPAEFYRPLWEVFGKGQNVEWGIGEGEHGFPPASRRLIAQFILKHFCGDERAIAEGEDDEGEAVFDEARLWASPTGNLYHDGIGHSAGDLARLRAVELQKSRPALTRDAILRVIGEREDAMTATPAVRREGREIGWEAEGGVPVRIVLPDGEPQAMIVQEEGGDGGLMAALSEGHRVATIDVRGTGVSAPGGLEPNNAFYAPMLMGRQANLARLALHQRRTLTGMRAIDLIHAARALPGVPIVAEGGMGLSLLLAAALEPEALARIVLYRTPVSWMELATGAGRFYNFAHYLPGVLERFDTPDLKAGLSEGKLLWVNPTRADGSVMDLAQARRAHRKAGVRWARVRLLAEAPGVVFSNAGASRR